MQSQDWLRLVSLHQHIVVGADTSYAYICICLTVLLANAVYETCYFQACITCLSVSGIRPIGVGVIVMHVHVHHWCSLPRARLNFI